MVGKWHLCAQDEMNLAASKRNWPLGRGFERFYGFLGAETNQWYPDLVHDNHPVDAPSTPAEGYHLSVDLTDKAIEFIDDVKTIAPERPVFLYYALGAAHAPHHVPQGVGRPVQGPVRHGLRGGAGADPGPAEGARHRPGRHRAAADQPHRHPGDAHRSGRPAVPAAGLHQAVGRACRADERRLFARMAEVYAGFLSHADAQIGRLLDYLEAIDQLDNTLIFVVSDNGASGEGGPNGSVNENKFFNGIPDDLAANLAMLDELGGPTTYNHYPTGWAMAFNTPFKMWKRYSFNGGTSDPCIVSWPAGIPARGEIRRPVPPRRSTSCRPCWSASASTSPTTVRGVTQIPIQGVSMTSSFAAAPTRRPPRTTQFFSMLGTRGIWHDGWKAVTTHPRHRRLGRLRRRTPGSCTTSTSTAPSCTTWPPRNPTGSPS